MARLASILYAAGLFLMAAAILHTTIYLIDEKEGYEARLGGLGELGELGGLGGQGGQGGLGCPGEENNSSVSCVDRVISIQVPFSWRYRKFIKNYGKLIDQICNFFLLIID